MAQGEQNGNGWMVLWKMGSPKKSPESPAASETRWKATVAPPHSQGAGWTSSRVGSQPAVLEVIYLKQFNY